MSSISKETNKLPAKPEDGARAHERTKRGRKSVEAALIAAASELLSEVGPKQMSVREVAALAGVNHGQVHHYFKGKEGLIRAAMRNIAEEHLKIVTQSAHGAPMPPPLTLNQDPRYQRAVIRLVLDGRVDLATMQIDDGVSVPRNILAEMTKSAGLEEPSIEAKAVLAAIMALEQGWGALEQFIIKMIDAKPGEMEQIRKLIIKVLRELPSTIGLEIPAEEVYGAPDRIVMKKNDKA